MTTIRRCALFLMVVGLVALSAVAVAAGEEKVTICHQPNTPAEKTMDVAAPAVDGHLGHGDTIGACSGGGPTAACDVLNDPALDMPYDSVEAHSLLFDNFDTPVTISVMSSESFSIYWENGPEGGSTFVVVVGAYQLPSGDWLAEVTLPSYPLGGWRVGTPTYLGWGYQTLPDGWESSSWSVSCG